MKARESAHARDGHRAGDSFPDVILAAIYSVLIVSFGMFVYVTVDMLRYFFW